MLRKIVLIRRNMASLRADKVTLHWVFLTICLVRSATEADYHTRGYLSDIQPIKYTQRAREKVNQRSPDIAIEKKIKEIKLYLQDEEAGVKIKEEDGETTIIEYTTKSYNLMNGKKDVDKSPESFQANLRKYKNIRNKIKLALERESVSNKTKQIVTKTLDELTATLEQTQFLETLKTNDLKKNPIFTTSPLNDLVPKITYDSKNNCYINDVKLRNEDCAVIREPYKYCQLYGKNISEAECNKLVQFALIDKPCYIGNKKYSADMCKRLAQNVTETLNVTSDSFKAYIRALLPSNDTETTHFYDSITKTVSKVLQESHTIPENYKVKSSVVDKEKVKKNLRNKDVCSDFRVCSNELKEFLTVFYQNLNHTAIRVFGNYAAMYDRDIITNESAQKDSVITAIKRAGDLVGDRMSGIFIRATSKIELDKNKEREMNMAALREFVKHTVKVINKAVNKHLEEDLSALSARLLLSIKKDLTHNLASDLKHLESDVVREICTFFITCNGILPTVLRRTHIHKTKTTANSDKVTSIVNSTMSFNNDLSKTTRNNQKAMRRSDKIQQINIKRQKMNYNNSNIMDTKTIYNKTINTNAQPTTRH